MLPLSPDDLPLQRLYRWERERANLRYLSQPMGGGILCEWTWAQALGEARRVGAYLRAQQWPAGSRVAILSKNSAYWLMADFAIWMAGHVSVPLYPTLAADSVRQILDHAEAKALFIGKLDAWPTMRAGVPEGVLRIATPLSPEGASDGGIHWDKILATVAPIADSPVREGSELATIIYTSGTTGMPKGVMHSFDHFAAASSTMSEEFTLGQEDRILSYLPLAHVAERVGVEANSVYNGFQVSFAESLDTFVKDIQRVQPTVFFSVPRLWVKFQQGIFAKLPKRRLDILFRIPVVGGLLKRKILQQLGLSQVRFAATGAAPLPSDVIEWYRNLGLDLLEVYGMTENFGISHTSRPETMRVGYVGAPWPHVECRLSEIGEVMVRAPWNMLGYYREPEKTRETFSADGFLLTGDLGEIDAQGRLRITGRAKEQFKTSKGKYVAPAPIENRLGAHPQVEAVCVAGANFQKPFAMLMLPAESLTKARRDEAFRAELDAQFKALLSDVNPTLDPHEQLEFLAIVPEQWTVDNGMVTPTMKIKRAAVEQAYGQYFQRWSASKSAVIWHA